MSSPGKRLPQTVQLINILRKNTLTLLLALSVLLTVYSRKRQEKWPQTLDSAQVGIVSPADQGIGSQIKIIPEIIFSRRLAKGYTHAYKFCIRIFFPSERRIYAKYPYPAKLFQTR
jgi:hypothetical protein